VFSRTKPNTEFSMARSSLTAVAAWVILGLLALLSTPAAATSLEPVTLQLKWFHQFQFAGYYAAIEKGFYAEEGLDVTLRERDPEYDPVDDVLAGRAEYGITDSGLFVAGLRGDPVVLVAQVFQHSPLILMTRREDGLRAPYQLQNRRIMTNVTGLTDTPILAMLNDALGGLDAAELVPYSFRPQDLTNRTVDAIAGYRTNEPFLLAEQGQEVTIIDPRDFGINFYGDNLFSTQTELAEHPGRVARMRRATLRGWEYALANPDEIIDLILERYNTQGQTRQHLEFQARETTKMIVPDFIELGRIEPSRIERIIETYARFGLTETGTLPNRFLYRPALETLPQDELRHLREQPVVRVGVPGGQAPLTYLEDGQGQGYLNDLMRQATGLLGLSVEWHPVEDHRAGLDALARGEIDAVTNFSLGTVIEPTPLQSDTVFQAPFVAVGHADSPSIRNVAALEDKRLILVAGFQQTRTIQNQYPQIATTLVSSITEAYRALRNGEGDYYIDNATHAGHFLRQFMVTDLEIKGELPVEELGQLQLVFAISASRPLLAKALDRALTSIGTEGLATLRDKWRTPTALAEQGSRPLDLTTTQREFLQRHPKIEIGVIDSWPPFGFKDADGNSQGISIDLIDALNRKLDGALVARPGSWQEIYQGVAERQLPALLDITPRLERQPLFEFTRPYLQIPHVIVARKDGPSFGGADALDGHTVALEEGFGLVQHFADEYPTVTVRTYATTADALEAVANREADAYVGNRAVAAYLIRNELFLELQIQGRTHHEGSVLAIGTRKDWPVLRDILQAALDSVSPTERQSILDRWTESPLESQSRELRLTTAERAWLEANPVIRVALDPKWAPIEYVDGDGRYQGISLDYLERLGERLSVRFEPFPLLSWEEAIEAVRTGAADMFASVARTPARSEFAEFTRPYIEIPIEIFTRRESGYVGNLSNLVGKRVAVPAGYATESWLRDNHPELKLVSVEGPEEGLKRVADGLVDAFVGNAAASNYYIAKNDLVNVHAAGSTPYANRQAMAVRKDLPILVPILQKALDTLTPQEHQAIFNRWMSVRFEQRIDYQLLWQVGIVATLILLVVGYANLRLSREVSRRSAVEQQLLDAQSQLEQRVIERTADLEETQGRFRATFEQAAVGIARIRPDGRLLEVNDRYCDIVGYTRAELLEMAFTDYTHPEDVETDRVLLNRMLSAESGKHQREKRYVRKDGKSVWVTLTVSLVRRSDGEPDYFISVIEDISERKRIENTLKNFFDQPITLNLIAALDGTIKRVNDTWREVLGQDPADLVDTSFISLVHPEDQQATLDEISKLESGKTTFYFENRYRHRDGSYRTLAWSAVANLGDGQIYAVATDISEKRKAEDKLREAAAVFGNTAEGVMITDNNGIIVDANEAFTSITGYDKDEVIGKNASLLQSGRHDRAFFQDMWHSLRTTGHWRGEVWDRRKDGTLFPELLTISQVTDAQGEKTGFVGVFADITAIKQTEEQLAHLAHHDTLTGLPNRLLFLARLDQSIRHAERASGMLAVLFVDLDRFKNINDSLGHPAGDDMLRQLAGRLSRLVRRDDTVARLSGDEFVVLLEDIGSAEHAALTVEKLMQAFAEPLQLEDTEVRMTASIGVSLYPQDGKDSSTLLKNADAAMYRAKDDGRNNYQFYTAELTSVAFEHMFLESALRIAVENDEFRLVYQPQFDLNSGQLIGLEALLRWEHPQQGTIPPSRFIPIAEQSGLIKDIGTWVIRNACAQASQWTEEGYVFGRVAVNVAGPQIQQVNFVDIVIKALDETHLDAGRLELEITESFVTNRTDVSIEQLSHLRTLGIEIAIDDFGTGYSSLSYLKQLPIDKLKIDQAFVRDIPDDPNDMAIAKAIIAMGKALGMKVIAEGVETEEQGSFLRQQGCEFAQGFYFSRPLSVDAVTELLERQKVRA
jgi:diguanylate cyclase (GGDEF)-like protein/PAS domain S-box-containing protein